MKGLFSKMWIIIYMTVFLPLVFCCKDSEYYDLETNACKACKSCARGEQQMLPCTRRMDTACLPVGWFAESRAQSQNKDRDNGSRADVADEAADDGFSYSMLELGLLTVLVCLCLVLGSVMLYWFYTYKRMRREHKAPLDTLVLLVGDEDTAKPRMDNVYVKMEAT